MYTVYQGLLSQQSATLYQSAAPYILGDLPRTARHWTKMCIHRPVLLTMGISVPDTIDNWATQARLSADCRLCRERP